MMIKKIKQQIVIFSGWKEEEEEEENEMDGNYEIIFPNICIRSDSNESLKQHKFIL